jgi:hypothetical protein
MFCRIQFWDPWVVSFEGLQPVFFIFLKKFLLKFLFFFVDFNSKLSVGFLGKF